MYRNQYGLKVINMFTNSAGISRRSGWHCSEHDDRKLTGPILDVNYELESLFGEHMPSLQVLCGKKVVSDSFLIRNYGCRIPNKMYIFLMDQALAEGRFPTISFLIKNWPVREFCFPQLPALSDWKLSCSYKKLGFSESVRQALECVAVVLHTFLQTVQEGRTDAKLKLLDLSAVPLTENLVLKISNCLYDTTMPPCGQVNSGNHNITEKWAIKMHCTLSSCIAVEALYHALLADNLGLASIKLSVCGLRFTNTSLLSEKSKELFHILDPLVLQVLSFDFASVAEQTMNEILSCLHKFHCLRVLDFSYSGLHGQNISALCDSFKQLDHISRLDFSSCGMRNRVEHILEHLHKNKTAFAHNNSSSVVNKKFKVMCSYPNCESRPNGDLEYLNLSGCSVSSRDLLHLARSPYIQTLKNLNLCNNLLGNHFESLIALLRALAPSLCVLELSNSYLRDEHMRDLFSILIAMQNLRCLAIAHLRSSHETLLLHLPELCKLPCLRILVLSIPDSAEKRIRTQVAEIFSENNRSDVSVYWQL